MAFLLISIIYFFSSVWINKGGTGKTTLTFQLSAAYADKHQENNTHVVVIDMCPRADVSDTLLDLPKLIYGNSKASRNLITVNGYIYNKTVSGYLMARLDRHDVKSFGVERFLTQVHEPNPHIPTNLHLFRGGVCLEELSKRLHQERQLLGTPYDKDPKTRVTNFIKDFIEVLSETNPSKNYVFFIDTESSMSIFTEMALAAADRLIVPFTADKFCVSAVISSLGMTYKCAKVVPYPLFVFNKVMFYKESPVAAFEVIRQVIINKLKDYFSDPMIGFAIFNVHDFHSTGIISCNRGCPITKVVGTYNMGFGFTVTISDKSSLLYSSDICNICKSL